MMETSNQSDIDTGMWYWDRRTDKAYYAVEEDGETVQFATVWHRHEAVNALDTGAVVPLEAMNFDRTGGTFDLKDSFRIPAADELPTKVDGD